MPLSATDDIPVTEPQQPTLLESRSLYKSCHVVLEETGERMPAIVYQQEYYSFFRSEKDKARAFELSYKLQKRGHAPILTRTPKGFAIWTYEPDAYPIQASHNGLVPPPPPYRMVTNKQDYQYCQISVPDLDKQLSAISYEGKLYSLFKAVDTLQQAQQLIKRLSYRGDETLILQDESGFSLWILEPDGFLTSAP